MNKKKLIVLILSLVLIAAVTAMARLCSGIDNTWLRMLANIGLNYTIFGIALVAMKITGIRLELDLKNYKQYLIGIAIALGLSIVIAFLPAKLGFSLVGSHTDFSWFVLVYSFFSYIFVVGVVEELVFRVYIQETIVGFFGSKKWLGVIISSFIFGLWHLINGSLGQVLFTFIIGLVFGFSKYLIKDCKYAGLALGHGLYDFLNVVITMFVI